MATHNIKMDDSEKEDMIFLLKLVINNHNENYTKELSSLKKRLSLAYAERAEQLIKILEQQKPAMR